MVDKFPVLLYDFKKHDTGDFDTKKKIAAGALVFLFFIAMVIAVIIKDVENRKAVDEITGNTIRNALENDSGMSMDEISAEFSDYAMESAGYKNLADIAYAQTDGDAIRLVFADCEIENAFYLVTRLIDESGGKTLLITWNGAEYEVNKGKAGNNEELADMFPDEWKDVVNKAFCGGGLQLGTDAVDGIDKAISNFKQ